MSNNKRRLLSLLDILKRYSDEEHPISEADLKALLSKDDIEIKNRKTIYEDISVLCQYGYNIEYDTKVKGYYLLDSPFKLAEIKILIDEINSLKDFNATRLEEKLLSFISVNDEKLLKQNQIKPKNKTNRNYLHDIEKILSAIKNKNLLSIEYNNKSNIIEPYFLYFSNSRYYLYLKYPGSKGIYSYRVDRIKSISKLSDTYEDNGDTLEEIKKRIKTSYDNYDKNKPQLIILKAKEIESIINRLDDDFPEYYLDNEKNIVIEYRPNEIFFSKLVSYGDKLKIKAPLETKEAYLEYLKSIIANYRKNN